ncbi:hypothetical protein PV326_005988 [Microctonus aethiopoides]|nr:hypothetical protein PV326_005988 [Microctonus aethiopoides]
MEKNDKNDNGDKSVKMSKAESNRQYRTPVLTAPLAQLSPDAGPSIIQYEAVTVYNSVNKKVRDVIDFLHEALLAYTKGGLKLLKKQYHELPLIPGGDFNIQFDTDEGLRCVQFLDKELNLDFVSGNTLGMIRHGTSIGIFSRYVNHVTSDVHVSRPNPHTMHNSKIQRNLLRFNVLDEPGVMSSSSSFDIGAT